MFDKLLDFVVTAVEQRERRKHEDAQKKQTPSKDGIYAERTVGSLVTPARKQGAYHREREKFYTKELERAEAELREKGISLEAFDSFANAYQHLNMNTLCSGSFSLPSQTLQPRVDQKLLEAVKSAKDKMLSHRQRAEQYEKYARMFSVCPNEVVRLSTDDVHYFRLEK